MIYRETEQGYEIIPDCKEDNDFLKWLLPKIAPSDMNERLREDSLRARKEELQMARVRIQELELKLKRRRKRQAAIKARKKRK